MVILNLSIQPNLRNWCWVQSVKVGDRKIKRRGLTEELPARSERSRSEIKMWSNPWRDEINWPKCRSNDDPSFIERYQIIFAILIIVSSLVRLCYAASQLFYLSKHFTRKSSVACSLHGPLKGKLWSAMGRTAFQILFLQNVFCSKFKMCLYFTVWAALLFKESDQWNHLHVPHLREQQ